MLGLVALLPMAAALSTQFATDQCPSGSTPGDEVSFLQAHLQVQRPRLATEEMTLQISPKYPSLIEENMTIMKAFSVGDCDDRILRLQVIDVQRFLPWSIGHDPEFPPDVTSLYPGSKAPAHWYDVTKWKTFQQIAEDSGKEFMVMPDNMNLHLLDIKQGELESCYLLAALAAIVNLHPQVIDRMFVDRELWTQEQRYNTQWIINGEETIISVDNMIPAGLEGTSFSSPSESGVWWPVILEKAWAKIYGNFAAIESGIARHAFAAISGAPDTDLIHSTLRESQVWAEMLDAVKNKFPIVGGTTANARRYGLYTNHAYGVLGVREKMVVPREARSDGMKHNYGACVKLFDPNQFEGNDGYRGQIEKQSTFVGEQKFKSGVFWMTVAEYFDAFDQTGIGKIRPDYVVTSRQIPVGQVNVVEVDFPSAGSFSASITWPGNRMLAPCSLGRVHPILKAVEKDNPTLILESRNDQLLDLPPTSDDNAISTAIDVTKPTTVEIFAQLWLPPEKNYITTMHLIVYAKEPVEMREPQGITAQDLALDIVGPITQDVPDGTPMPCSAIETPAEETFQRDDGRLTPLESFTSISSVPTFWEEEESADPRFIFWCALTKRWLVASAHKWTRIQTLVQEMRDLTDSEADVLLGTRL